MKHLKLIVQQKMKATETPVITSVRGSKRGDGWVAFSDPPERPCTRLFLRGAQAAGAVRVRVVAGEKVKEFAIADLLALE